MAGFVYALVVVVLLLVANPSTAAASYNVLGFGAKPNGVADCTQAFLDAWLAACNSTASTIIYVPKGRYLLRPVKFTGDECKSRDITLRIDGTLVAPVDYQVLGAASNWLSFNGVNGVSIIGGRLDAKGPALWACKASGYGNCPSGATTLRFVDSSNIRINGLLSINSQMFHVAINRCENVDIEGVKIIAPADSPNTDGIHVQLSSNVKIFNSSIKTGDDCISIGPGTQNLWIERVTCGPGHGISIGSLGKDMEEEGVRNITVKKTIFSGTDNGLRIKSWPRPSNGFVQRVRFLNSAMKNVSYPIIIDQNYCPDHDCSNQVSGVKISDVIYYGIQGSSATPIAIQFDCSSKYPCSGIRLQNVNLTYGDEVAESSCKNVIGKALGSIHPQLNCFKS